MVRDQLMVRSKHDKMVEFIIKHKKLEFESSKWSFFGFGEYVARSIDEKWKIYKEVCLER